MNSAPTKKSGLQTKKRDEWKYYQSSLKVIHNKMKPKRSDLTEEQARNVDMSPAQKEVFLVIDEWWKKYGYSPTIRDIAYVRGKMGLGSTLKIVNRLVALGVIKKMDGVGRTIRPVYIQFKNLE